MTKIELPAPTGGPDEEDGTDTSQSCVERLGHGEVAGDDFDVRWQRRRRLGAMREGADRHARVDQEVDYDAPRPEFAPVTSTVRPAWSGMSAALHRLML